MVNIQLFPERQQLDNLLIYFQIDNLRQWQTTDVIDLIAVEQKYWDKLYRHNQMQNFVIEKIIERALYDSIMAIIYKQGLDR
jgi:hypothetical protein